MIDDHVIGEFQKEKHQSQTINTFLMEEHALLLIIWFLSFLINIKESINKIRMQCRVSSFQQSKSKIRHC
jgi:hypothetical protein